VTDDHDDHIFQPLAVYIPILFPLYTHYIIYHIPLLLVGSVMIIPCDLTVAHMGAIWGLQLQDCYLSGCSCDTPCDDRDIAAGACPSTGTLRLGEAIKIMVELGAVKQL